MSEEKIIEFEEFIKLDDEDKYNMLLECEAIIKHECKIVKEVREYIESKNNGICYQNGIEKGAYTFVLNFDEAREFIWHILEILDKENKE